MCSAACASSRFLPSEAYGGSFPTTPIPGCMSYWISWALITGCTHGLQVRVSSERLEGRRLKKKPTDSTGQGCEMVVSHEASHAFLSASNVVDVPQLRMNARRTVGASAQSVDTHDVFFEHLVLLVAPRGYSLPPRIVTTGGDTQQTTH